MFRIALISMFLTSTALATTWTVDDDGKADFDNIQDAVDAASDGDMIFVYPGTYTSTADEVVNMLGKAVTLRSLYPDNPDIVATTIIDGEGLRRGILCNSDETNKTIIEGFTITHGYASYGGGGMYCYSSNPELTDCTFTSNIAEQDGGGMYCNGGSRPTLTRCHFINNSSNNFSGGGMYCGSSSNAILDLCVFKGNIADNNGGGMACFNASPTLTNCIFDGNSANLTGGGIRNSNSSPNLMDCTINGNSSENAGGMYSDDYSNPTLTDTTVCGNTPDQIYGDWTDNGGNTICPPECPDINGDGYVNVVELLTVIDQWGLTDSPADVNADGVVDVSDLLIVVGNWGPCE